jgi:putative flavoprotein involved in K+ transport
MSEIVDVAVIGAGQAGLSLSYELSRADMEHVVLERGRVGQSWRGLWDSFCLVTPNWSVQLPGGSYRGTDPHGFMPRDEIVQHLVSYANSFKAPVREGVEVFALDIVDGKRFVLRTSQGEIRARRVVVASGGFQRPYRPPGADRLPASVRVIDAADYTNPASLPHGRVMVVGSGQTGCQLAEDLSEAGREVFLSCGRAPWMPRRLGDRDFVAWFTETTFLEATVHELPTPLARLGANVQATGRGSGRDLHYRTLHARGVTLLGRFAGCEDGVARFADDLAASVAFGDARYADLCGLIRKACIEKHIDVPEMPSPPAFTSCAPTSLDMRSFGAVIFTSGYRPHYARWINMTGAFDELGYPIQKDGSSTVIPGLHFMGVHFQRKRKSASFLGVAEDAAVLAERIRGDGGTFATNGTSLSSAARDEVAPPENT